MDYQTAMKYESVNQFVAVKSDSRTDFKRKIWMLAKTNC